MKHILTVLKVLTFINIKIVILSVLLIILSVFGYKSISSSLDRTNYLVNGVVQNEIKVVRIASINYQMTKKDNEILSKCLNRRIDYEKVEEDVDELIFLKDQLKMDSTSSKRIDSLLVAKVLVFKKISNFDVSRVHVNDILESNTVKVVSKSTKKSLFKTKVEYNTFSRQYYTINRKMFEKESNKASLKNSSELNKLIKENNELNLKVYLITNTYSLDMFNSNMIEYKIATDKIKDNLINYLIYTTLIMLFSGLVIYLLISDILKKQKSESRYRQMISMMIENHDKK
jgi:hypothetical protein